MPVLSLLTVLLKTLLPLDCTPPTTACEVSTGTSVPDVHGGGNAVGGDDARSREDFGMPLGLLRLKAPSSSLLAPTRVPRDRPNPELPMAILSARPNPVALRSHRFQECAEPFAEGAVEIQFVDFHLDQHLARRHIELPQQIVDLLPFLRRALNQQGIVERIRDDAGNPLAPGATVPRPLPEPRRSYRAIRPCQGGGDGVAGP